jgi:acyl dehydratase
MTHAESGYMTAQAGKEFHWDAPIITTTQLVQYAGASGDFNRLHFDHAFAVAAGMEGVIAHGMLTMGLMATALEHALQAEEKVLCLRARFIAPVRPGDQVRIVLRNTAQECADDVLTTHCQIEAWVRQGDEVDKVAQGEARIETRRGFNPCQPGFV